ncbi:MAG: thymidine phosphorylase [Bdellovibrionales bacterium]
MSFLPDELIRKKRQGFEHTRGELHFLIDEYVKDRLPDYQMSAWLMAVCFQGMSSRETAWFTQEMRDSGIVLNLAHLGMTVDKHSTGGIGDKTSLLLAPIVAAAGVKVPMMAGRGLAHTGGTLDKLESLAGFRVGLSLAEFKQQLEKVGTAIIGQTLEICPADRKLYALRDVTGTVDSLPLICGSIMSKKLAEGMSALVLDVKFGTGAFMKTVEDAEQLARALINIGHHAEKKVIALLTRMDEPLGRFVGNALEVKECWDILCGQAAPSGGKTYADTVELTLELAAHMLVLSGQVADVDAGRAKAREVLTSGQARQKFLEMCKAQGMTGELTLKDAHQSEFFTAPQSGFVHFQNAEKLGRACIHIRAGRKVQSDKIDHAAGLEILVRQGDRVEKGQPLVKIHYNQGSIEDARADLAEGLTVTSERVERSPLIAKVIQ